MKTTSQTIKKIPQVLYAVLLSIACVLFVILVVGTIIGLVRSRSSQPLINFGADVSANITPGSQAANTNPQSDDIRIYSGLERMRIPLADSSILILSIVFPYPANDIAFTEELAVKVNDFRSMAYDYFSSLPQESLIQIDEDTAKREILRSFNNNLRLGYIRSLYFNDMMVIAPAVF